MPRKDETTLTEAIIGMPIGIAIGAVFGLLVLVVMGFRWVCSMAWQYASRTASREPVSPPVEAVARATQTSTGPVERRTQRKARPAQSQADTLDTRGARQWQSVLVDQRTAACGKHETHAIELADPVSGERTVLHGMGLSKALRRSKARPNQMVSIALLGHQRLLHEGVAVRRKVWEVQVLDEPTRPIHSSTQH